MSKLLRFVQDKKLKNRIHILIGIEQEVFFTNLISKKLIKDIDNGKLHYIILSYSCTDRAVFNPIPCGGVRSDPTPPVYEIWQNF